MLNVALDAMAKIRAGYEVERAAIDAVPLADIRDAWRYLRARSYHVGKSTISRLTA